MFKRVFKGAKSLQKILFSFALLFFFILAAGRPIMAGAQEYLSPDDAFKFSARMIDANTVLVRYEIADGYYLYRERFHFQIDGGKLGEPLIPAGVVKFDEAFQKKVEIYRKSVAITVPVSAADKFRLRVASQGCADQGLCYAPVEKEILLSPRSVASGAATFSTDGNIGKLEATLSSGKLWFILPFFFLLGIGLSLTPCVLPMAPILSSLILGADIGREGGGRKTQVWSRELGLSASYAVGMALIYATLGVAAGLAGQGWAAVLQHPWMLMGFAGMMVLLALPMFGIYQLQMPLAIQQRLMQISKKQVGGTLWGAFAMGAVSALIVSPCIAAPLAAVLLFIGRTHNVVAGGSALFALALGMSVPLLLIGASAGVLLPRAGKWMEQIKRGFGVMMLALALWTVSPVLPAAFDMVGWALLSGAYGVYWLWHIKKGWLEKGPNKWLGLLIGLLLVAWSAIQIIGLVTGGRNAWAPLSHLTGASEKKLAFTRVDSVAELDKALAQASGKIVLLDFYADWCVACKEMERFTLSNTAVQARLSGMTLLRVDVTANTSDDKALLKHFKLYGPPALIFFDRQGREITERRVIGYQRVAQFLQTLSFISSLESSP